MILAADQDESPILDDIIDLADEAGVDIRELPRGRFDQMAATESPQGVVAFAAPLREFAVEELVADPRAGGVPGDDGRLYLSAGAEHTERRTPAPLSAEADPDHEGDEDDRRDAHEDDRRDAHEDDQREADEADRPETGPEESPGQPSAESDDTGLHDGAPVAPGAPGAPEAAAQAGAPALLLVVDGVDDPGNLGAILRTAECAGVTGVVLPRHRAARITPTVAKRAAGAIEHLRFAPVSGIPTALATLSELGVWTVGLEVAATQTVWELDIADAPLALVLGAEGRGLSRLVRRRCDVTARIPVTGRLDALNVSAAAAVALFEVLRRRDTD